MTEPTLDALREAGAHHHDPARFHYLEVLEQRIAGQPDAVRHRLSLRLQAALADYAQRVHEDKVGTPATRAAAQVRASAHAAPLTRLNRYIQERAQSEATHDPLALGGPASDMKSVRRFSEVWAKLAAEQQVVQATERAPENAGPLNSHRLMLRSLTLMRSLSPDYLGRFLTHMEALLWLDQVNQQTSLKDSKAKRPTRAKK